MRQQYRQRLDWLGSLERALLAGRIGLEKESLRVGADGVIAQTPHPAGLGSALTHPSITTDYSEAQLELVTPPYADSVEALAKLDQIHRFVQSELEALGELLWASSMPCVVNGEASVPIARFGDSNQGRFRHVYRRGLGQRYGKTMQVISGIHINYSLPDDFWPAWGELRGGGEPRELRDGAYFGLIRNVRRYGWLAVYLFGCSPAVCKSFLKNSEHKLREYDANTWYLPYATSLRMSDIGYSNKKRCGLKVAYDSLHSYLDGLDWAVSTPCLPYQLIGVKKDGEYLQLNANVLQIANEYYSVMRPKQPPRAGETPLDALRRRGVAYVELRSSDVGLFEANGLGPEQLRFIEVFLLFCLLADSPPIDETEQRSSDANYSRVATAGRDPELRLDDRGTARSRSLQDWGEELLDALAGIAEVLDRSHPERPYRQALDRARAALADPGLTPSAQVLAGMADQGLGFFHFAKAWSQRHREYFLRRPLEPAQYAEYRRLAAESLEEQRALERAGGPSFDDYLAALNPPSAKATTG